MGKFYDRIAAELTFTECQRRIKRGGTMNLYKDLYFKLFAVMADAVEALEKGDAEYARFPQRRDRRGARPPQARQKKRTARRAEKRSGERMETIEVSKRSAGWFSRCAISQPALFFFGGRHRFFFSRKRRNGVAERAFPMTAAPRPSPPAPPRARRSGRADPAWSGAFSPRRRCRGSRARGAS